MPSWTNKSCTLSYNKETPYITIQWHGYATSLQFREVHEKLVSLMLETNIYKVLADNTYLPQVDSIDEKWISDNWLPRAIKAGYSALSVLTSRTQSSKVVVDYMLSNRDKNVLTIECFDNINKARQWIIDFKK